MRLVKMVGIGLAGSLALIALAWPGVTQAASGSSLSTRHGVTQRSLLATSSQSIQTASNKAPVITSAAKATFTVGVSVKFHVTATGSPIPTVTEIGAPPSGLKFTPGLGSGLLSGTPALATGGLHTLKFSASNGVGTAPKQTFTLTILQEPKFTSASSESLAAGSLSSFLVTTTGYPAPALSEMGALPAGMTFTPNGNGTGTLAGTPTTSGNFLVMVTASNGVGIPIVQGFSLTVQAPGCSITWIGTSSNSWTDPTNWGPARLPSTSDWACIPASSSGQPVQLVGTSTVGGLTNSGGLTINGSLTLTAPSEASSSTGSLILNGTLGIAGSLGVSGTFSASGTLEGAGTTTVGPGATLEASNLSLDGGTLINQGAGTAEPSSSLYVAAGATFTNQGTLTLDSSSSIDGACAIAATPTSPALPAGTMNNTGSIRSAATPGFPSQIGYPNSNYCLVFNDFGPITIASNELDLGGVTNLDSGASITGPSSTTLDLEGTITANPGSTMNEQGAINENGTLVANTGVSLPLTSVGGTIEIAPGVTVHASSVPSMTGTIQLDGSGGFGQMVVTGSASLNSESLYFSSAAFTPVCGTSVTALQAASIAGSLGSVYGGVLPLGGTWTATVSPTTAGALMSC